MSKHITERGAKQVRRAARKMNGRTKNIAGPSTNPATNLLIQDILLRSAGRLTRHTLEKGLLRRRYDAEQAHRIVKNRSMLQTLATYGVTKLATRSIPGALLVGGGLLAKTIYDRNFSSHKARREGDKDLAEQAKK